MPARKAQLELPLQDDVAGLVRRFERALGKPVSLVLTDNSSTMFSARLKDGAYRLRLHRMFLRAGDEVIEELSSYAARGRGGSDHFRRFVRDNRAAIRQRPGRKKTPEPKGKHHDLSEIFRGLNRSYFDGALRCDITWGTRPAKRSVKVRTLGTYSPDRKLVRINTVLDRKGVPRYYLAYVVYHEMLHAALGPEHSRGFKRREKLYRHYEKAMAWESRNIG